MRHVTRKTFLSPLLLLLCLLGCARTGFATTVVIPNDDDMIIGARAIIRAKVLSVGSGLDEREDRIFTYVTLRVQEVYKGEIAERKIVLKQEGGQVGDRVSIIFGTPQFTPGEKVLLYLETWPDGSFRTHQLFLGKFNIIKDPQTGRRLVVRSAPDENTTVLQSDVHSGTKTEKMELAAYVEMVRERMAANLERMKEFEETWYRDAPMLAQPPEYADMSSGGGIQPYYTFLGNLRWFEPDSGQPVVFKVNPAGAPTATILDDVNAAMAVWSTNIPGCALRVTNGGSTSLCRPTSTDNTIIFNNCDGRWSASTCSSTLALGGFEGSISQTRVINGVTFYRASRGFVSFNPYAACHMGNSCNVREIATHELGHALGLGHSQFSDATMAAYAHFDGRCAGLRQDDRDGITFIYPATGGPLTITTTSPLAAATAGSAYSQTLAATGGSGSYTWSLVSGALPAGISLSAGGIISGTTSATGTFNFTVRVTDSAAATAQKDFSLTVNAAGTQYNSQFMTQTVPTTLQPGQVFQFNLQWQNTGTQAWNGSAGFTIKSQNPPNNKTWGGDTVQLTGFNIGPGQTLNVNIQAIAPSTPGVYNFQWQLHQNPGPGFFGQMSANVAIQVGSVNYVGHVDYVGCDYIGGWAA
ncbi:MAG TPA: putative Ig domain-containing protein, partial [Blastocatellia bacterium]|nr:putative Ig domain-containing protein [Blastocatellia bacterium]